MKLPVKKEFFDELENGLKDVEYRDAHITFVCEETGRTLTREVVDVNLFKRCMLPLHLKNNKELFTDKKQIHFTLD